MIVTIDGPAGAGKSTVARRLAKRLGFRFLDTGAMYRCVAYAVLRWKLDFAQPAAIADLARHLDVNVSEERVLLNGEDVTQAIRHSSVTAVIHYVADNPAVREHLVRLQRRFAEHQSIVTEGRDQGTVVFPRAECKIFLTASPHERALRRQKDLERRGERITFEEVLAQQTERDRRDAEREFGGMQIAADAIEVCTDGLTQDEVVDQLEAVVRQRQLRTSGFAAELQPISNAC